MVLGTPFSGILHLGSVIVTITHTMHYEVITDWVKRVFARSSTI